MNPTIQLFKALPISVKRKKTNKSLLEKTIKRGFIFSPEVIYNYTENELTNLIDEIGITAEQMNSAFHKSWQKIKETDIEQLVVEQIAHYLTTYGKEQPEEYIEEKGAQWGVDNLGGKIIGLKDFESNKVGGDYVYIPNEKLEVPGMKEDINLVIIKGYTKKELKEKLLKLLDAGVALKEDTIKDVIEVSLFLELNEKDIENIKNKEVKSALYDYLNLVPENPVEFLRYIIFKSTEKTLLIKDSSTIEKIKESKNLNIINLFTKYDSKCGLERLAEIFYRFKPIFLAFRTNTKLKKTINKIRRLAVKYHKPMPEDYLNEITAKIKKGEEIDKKKLEEELDRVNTFRKIRLAYALKFRTKNADSILYRIRNNKSYATDFNFEHKTMAKRILEIVLNSISKDVSKNVKGKKVFIPENINYSLPATEKQFTGNFPSGSFVSIPKDMVFGIHWENQDSHTIDLDLSVISDNEKFGWDSSYRSEGKDVLFSGDVTDASEGASELFYVKKQVKNALILVVNYYNYDENIEVPFKIIVAKEQVSDLKKNYMVDPNNVIAATESKIDQKQKVLGLLVTTTNECKFYFAETYLGKSITSSNSEFMENSRKYLFDFYQDTINLKDILIKAGAKIVKERGKSDIDLSPESLEKDSILKLIIK